MIESTPEIEAQYFAIARHLYPERSWRRYLEQLFKHAPIAGRSVLDIGGGNGAISFYAASQGADAVCLEPAGAGSNSHMRELFYEYQNKLGPVLGRQVGLVEDTFQNLDSEPARYDVVVINNAINHFDERACQFLLEDQSARDLYLLMFHKLAGVIKPNGHLIVADCARKNLWNRLGLQSPFAPTIEWEIHQQPEMWARLLEQVGFTDQRVRWDPHARLGAVGQALLGNRLGAYLTNSHFILTMRLKTRASPWG